MSSVVLLSGGIDSAVALADARRRGRPLVGLFVDYGQRAARLERKAARAVGTALGVDMRRAISVDIGDSISSALLGQGPITPETSVLPARNAVLLSLAAGVAVTYGCRELVIGCSQEDQEVYRDCRPGFLEDMARALRLASGATVHVTAPLVTMRKRQIIQFARDLGAFDALAHTWSCYTHGPLPCGACPSCHERQAAFASLGVDDPAPR